MTPEYMTNLRFTPSIIKFSHYSREFISCVYRQNMIEFMITYFITSKVLKSDLEVVYFVQEIAEPRMRDVLLHAWNEYNTSAFFPRTHTDTHVRTFVRYSRDQWTLRLIRPQAWHPSSNITIRTSNFIFFALTIIHDRNIYFPSFHGYDILSRGKSSRAFCVDSRKNEENGIRAGKLVTASTLIFERSNTKPATNP